MITKSISISAENLIRLFGPLDEYARLIEQGLNVRLDTVNGELYVSGEDEDNVRRTEELIENLLLLIGMGIEFTREKVTTGIDLVLMDKPDDIVALSTEVVAVTSRGKYVRCKTVGQRNYVNQIKKNTL